MPIHPPPGLRRLDDAEFKQVTYEVMGVVFELKADEVLHDRHRSQALNNLFLLELPHGKLVNLGGEQVQHEFINALLSRAERIGFSVDDGHYSKTTAQAPDLREVLVPILRDWGTCLDVKLYEEQCIPRLFVQGERGRSAGVLAR